MMNAPLKLHQRLWASVSIGIRTGLHEMRSHKLRCALSLLGVLLGVAALVAMLTIVGGVDDFMKREMGSFAGRVGITGEDPPTDPKEQYEWSRSPGFRFRDFDFLEALRDVGKVYRSISHKEIVGIGRRREYVRLMGTNRENLEAETRLVLEEGRWFTDGEYAQGFPVCVVSWRIAETYTNSQKGQKDQSVIGKPFHIMGKSFTIVGVFNTKSKKFGKWHFRRAVYIPIKALQQYKTGFNPDPGFGQMEIANLDQLEQALSDVGEKLARHHRSVEDFQLHVFDRLKDFIQLLNNVKTLFTIIALASLTVGGLGIMNVMLSSLSERVREIGVRKALGAGRAQIFIQFLVETVVLSLVGGVAGAFVGMLPAFFSEAIYQHGGELIKPQLQFVHVVYVFWIVVLLGVIFGLYPAIKASRMNPIDALRYE